MRGMNAHTGKTLEGMAHIRQSINDVLTTPVGSRVMRRDYGSLLSELMAQPLNDATILRIYAATVMALVRWEPRVKVLSVAKTLSVASPGRISLIINVLTSTGEQDAVEVSPI